VSNSDRAAAVATAIQQIILCFLKTSALHAELTEYLRDELADATRQAINEIRPHDE